VLLVHEKCVSLLPLIPSGRKRLDESEQTALQDFHHFGLGSTLQVGTICSDGITEVPAGRGQEESDAVFPTVECGPGVLEFVRLREGLWLNDKNALPGMSRLTPIQKSVKPKAIKPFRPKAIAPLRPFKPRSPNGSF